VPTPTSVTHTVAYGAKDIKSLKALEFSCERDESNLFANIQSLQLATADDIKATAVIYKDVDGFNMGFLTFVEYKNDVDMQSQKAIHEGQGETFLFEGKAYVNNKSVKVLVFREKPAK
jgi:hypothetical protein